MTIQEIVAKLQGIAQTGLYYTKDVYDRERYEELQTLAQVLLEKYSDADAAEIQLFLEHEVGYATPKIDVRAVILNAQQEILLVKEVTDGKWSLPGGWGDIGYSPKEVAEKEVFEEAGIRVKALRLLGVLDKAKHDFSENLFYTYKFFIECQMLETELKTGIETLDCGFFSIADCETLTLSEGRITFSTLKAVYEKALLEHPVVDCD